MVTVSAMHTYAKAPIRFSYAAQNKRSEYARKFL